MFFWNFLVLSMIQQMLAIWYLVLLPFWNPACRSGSSYFVFCWNWAWKILSITLPVCDMSTTVWEFEHSLRLLLWNLNENWPFPHLRPHCWVFEICWHIEYTTLTASSFRILNSSAGILLSSLVLLGVMLPKAHLTSHSKMSGYGWVTTQSWLSG